MSDRPNEWIIGFDGSPSSKSAARWAAANAAGRADSIRLVHVWSIAAATVYSAFEPTILAESISTVERVAHQTVDRFAAELATESPVPVSTVVVQGDASNVLLDAAGNARQLVLGARGNGGFERLLLGSTSTRCATHASVPTVVVRDTDEPLSATNRIVVGFDGSDNAIEAVDWACSFAVPGSSVEIVAVWEFAPSLFSGEPFYYPEAKERARGLFADQIQRLPLTSVRDDIDVTTVFLEGSPREKLAEAAEPADLLVIGARGRGAIGAALLGSVSTWMLHHVRLPVAVIPHDG